jgi:hypothetical protein
VLGRETGCEGSVHLARRNQVRSGTQIPEESQYSQRAIGLDRVAYAVGCSCERSGEAAIPIPNDLRIVDIGRSPNCLGDSREPSRPVRVRPRP